MKHLGLLGLLLALVSCDVVDIVGTMNSTKDLHAVVNAGKELVVTFDANGGTGTMATQSIGVGKTAKLSLFSTGTIARSGYTFAGWVSDSATSTADYLDGADFTMGTSDVTLYALWSGTPSSAKEITEFSILAASNSGALLTRDAIGTITGSTIKVAVAPGTSLTSLIPTFATTGSSVTVGGTAQVSGTSAQVFSGATPLTYIVSALDGTTKSYSVTVVVQEILAFAKGSDGGSTVGLQGYRLAYSDGGFSSSGPLLTGFSLNAASIHGYMNTGGQFLFMVQTGSAPNKLYHPSFDSSGALSAASATSYDFDDQPYGQPVEGPGGKFVYQLVYTGSAPPWAVHMFPINQSTGLLEDSPSPTTLAGMTAGAIPGQLTFSPDGKYAFIPSSAATPENGLYFFKVESNGTLTSQGLKGPWSGGQGPTTVAVDPTSSIVVAGKSGKIVVHTLSNGVLSSGTDVSSMYMPNLVTKIIFGANSKYFHVLDGMDKMIYAYSVTSPPAVTPISLSAAGYGNLPYTTAAIFGASATDLVVYPGGKFEYMLSGQNTWRYVVDTSTGDITSADTSQQAVGSGLTFDATGKYGITFYDDGAARGLRSYTVNPGSGVLTWTNKSAGQPTYYFSGDVTLGTVSP